MSSTTQQQGRNWSPAVDLALMVVVLYVSAWIRTNWADLAVTADSPWFQRRSNELAYGLQLTGRAQYLYTSIPCLLFGGFLRLFDDPMRMIRAWAVFGSLAAPIAYLAARMLTGRLAGTAVGLLMAFSSADISVVTGIKSPYNISLFTACIALGLVAGTQRRPWGPPMLIFGCAMAVGHHVGLWILAPIVCLLATAHLLTIPLRRVYASALVALALGGLVVYAVAELDGETLFGDVASLEECHPSLTPSGGTEQRRGLLASSFEILLGDHPLSDTARCGLNMTPAVVILFLLTSLGGCVVFIAARPRKGATSDGRDRSRWVAAAVSVQLLVLVIAGIAPYMGMAVKRGYLEYHHLVSLLPLVAVGMVGAARAMAPQRWRWIQATSPAVLVFVWIGLVEIGVDGNLAACSAAETDSMKSLRNMRSTPPLIDPSLHRSSWPDETYSLLAATTLSNAIRDDARSHDGHPIVFGWFDMYRAGHRDNQPVIFTTHVEELTRSSWRTTGLQHSCYLILRAEDAATVPRGRSLPREPDAHFAAIAFESCDEFISLEETLCDLQSSLEVVGLHKNSPFTIPPLPCVYTVF